MHCSLAELGQRFSAAEIRAWEVFDTLEPIGFLRDDYRLAHLVQAVMLQTVTKLPSLEDCMTFPPRRFDAEPEPETFTLAGWRTAAAEAGIEVNTSQERER